MNIHENNTDIAQFLTDGWVIVGQQTWRRFEAEFSRLDLDHPDHTCLRRMRPWVRGPFPVREGLIAERQFGYCLLDKGHKGRHSTNVFYCDICGHVRIGQPRYQDEDVAMCFLCTRVPMDQARYY